MSRKVNFSVNTGYVGSDREEEFDLEDLGIVESEYETEEKLEDAITDAYSEWLWDNIDGSWTFVD